MRAELQELGGDGLADLSTVLVVDVELCDVVDVPLYADLLADVVTKLVVRVESAELLYTLIADEGEVCLHEQRRRILTGRSCLLIAGAVLKHINRCDPLLPGVLEPPVFSGVILRFFPLRPHLEELLHREQFPTLEHLVNILA